jgi:hypothetical protein
MTSPDNDTTTTAICECGHNCQSQTRRAVAVSKLGVTAIERRRQEHQAQRQRAQEMRRLGFDQCEIHDSLEFFWYAYLQEYEWSDSGPYKLSILAEAMNAQATKARAVHISSAGKSKKRQLQAQEYHERQESDCCLKDDREILAIHLNILAQNVLEAGNKED